MRGDGVRLPSRFPVGTRYVIEGHEGRIRLRYLEFPDGTFFPLPVRPAKHNKHKEAPAGRRARRLSSRSH